MVSNRDPNQPERLPIKPGERTVLPNNSSTITPSIASRYEILQGTTPVECTHLHHHGNQIPYNEKKLLQKLPSKLPTPKIIRPVTHAAAHSETQPRNNSFVAMLGGSGINSKRGSKRNNSGFSNSRMGRTYGGRSSFLPSNSALNLSFHLPTANASTLPRPSRHLKKSELYELKDHLWQSSISCRPSNILGESVVGCDHSQAPGQLPFPTQAFNATSTSVSRYEGDTLPGIDDARNSSMPFIPLPRESVAMLVDAVRVSALHDDEKCRFLFELFDVEHRGVLSKDGVRAFIEATFAANGVNFLGEFDYDTVVTKIFDRCRQHDKMTYGEFKEVFATIVAEADDNKSKGALERLSAVVETQRQQEMETDFEEGGCWYRVKKYYRKHDAEIFWLTLYFMLMVSVFIAKASRFAFDPAVGNWPRIAKGFAEICLVNTMFVLLPMCRNFVTGLRTLPVVVNYLPVDHHIEFHKICGVVLLLASLGHTAAWLAIVIYVRTVPLAVWKESAYHHLAFVRDENLFLFTLRVPIWTGVTMLLCAGTAAPLCLAKIRRGKFNLFWVSHMLFVPFLVLMAFHGFARWVASPQAHYWVLPPVIIYLIEKRYRMTQVFGGKTTISHVHLSKATVAIFMKKPKSFGKRQRFLPGMYVFINVPTISKFEWHPFTISSAPEDAFLSLHIQKAGDWTGALYDHLAQLRNQSQASHMEDQGNFATSHYPTIFLDGPIGAPAQDYARYREIVLIGAGIGVTPFASILRSIMHQWESFRCPHCRYIRFPPNFQLRKIYFYWVTREQESLTWFTNTMNQLSEMDSENRLEIHNFYSAVKSESVIAPLQALQDFIHNTEGQDIISGLHTKQKTHFGRPDWKTELTRVALNHRRLEPLEELSNEREEIGVFFCGPKSLGNVIDEQCVLLNQAKVRQTPDVEFDFHSENF